MKGITPSLKGFRMETEARDNNCDRQIFTTGQVAKICNVSFGTVAKWFDNGVLRGFRIPGLGSRGYTRTTLIRFMQAYDFPTDKLGSPFGRVLICSANRVFADQIAGMLRCSSVRASWWHDVSRICYYSTPRVVVLDFRDVVSWLPTVRALTKPNDVETIPFLFVVSNGKLHQDLPLTLAKEVYREPVDLRALTKKASELARDKRLPSELICLHAGMTS